MLIELSRWVTIHPGTFTAVIAPEKKILAALNSNRDLQRFLFLYVSGNYSRILSGISRTSANFEVRRPFTADQLLTVVHESGHTIVFVEHDPTLFDGADRLLDPVASALRQAGREALVILWAPASDRSFAALARRADRIIEIIPEDPAPGGHGFHARRSCREGGGAPGAQRTLDVS
jgi:DNA polymerase I